MNWPNAFLSLYKFQKHLPPVPTAPNQFYSAWKDLDAENKYYYLKVTHQSMIVVFFFFWFGLLISLPFLGLLMKSIPLNDLNRILGAGFNSDVFADLISTLELYYVPRKDPDLAECLVQICKNRQISILSLMMSTSERNGNEKSLIVLYILFLFFFT